MAIYEQLSFDNIEVSEPKPEIKLFQKIYSFIKEKYDDAESVTLKVNKSYLSICFFRVPKLRIKKVKNEVFLEIPEHFKDELNRHNIENTVTADHYYRVKVPGFISNNLRALISDIYEYCYRKYSDERFDCCSRYLECSDNKMCCYEGQKFSRACSYHYKLKDGIIFFGKNRTIK
ncbi:MAG: hypothetical protein GXX10_11310 [Clostridiaceae bacterium]|nr:hypothetical protein [Clostridiaceae bacterium]